MNIGIDIVENKRLENSNIKFIEKILTKKEIEIMNKKVGRHLVDLLLKKL